MYTSILNMYVPRVEIVEPGEPVHDGPSRLLAPFPAAVPLSGRCWREPEVDKGLA